MIVGERRPLRRLPPSFLPLAAFAASSSVLRNPAPTSEFLIVITFVSSWLLSSPPSLKQTISAACGDSRARESRKNSPAYANDDVAATCRRRQKLRGRASARVSARTDDARLLSRFIRVSERARVARLLARSLDRLIGCSSACGRVIDGATFCARLAVHLFLCNTRRGEAMRNRFAAMRLPPQATATARASISAGVRRQKSAPPASTDRPAIGDGDDPPPRALRTQRRAFKKMAADRI